MSHVVEAPMTDAKQQMQQQQLHTLQPATQRQRSKQETMKPAKKKTATATSILCELTRLKTQQKYLECNQVKLNPNNFLDDEENHIVGAAATAETKGNPNTNHTTTNLINEIERLKFELDGKLQIYHKEKHHELQDMWHYLSAIKDDVFQPERLSQYTVNALRERIIAVNAQLERLSVKNDKELETLKQEYEKLEQDNKVIWKGAI